MFLNNNEIIIQYVLNYMEKPILYVLITHVSLQLNKNILQRYLLKRRTNAFSHYGVEKKQKLI